MLGKYTVERQLGAGGMGVVLAVRHQELDELFAMKVMAAEHAGSVEAIERFLREARAAAKLKSQHICKVHDVGRLEGGLPYMLLEHLEGRDLRALLKQRRLSVSEAVGYALELLDALDEAHAHQIIHRDLKPANLFLSERANGSTTLKVLDFGISKQTAAPDEMTLTHAVIGTPFYMSPEQMRSARTVDHRSDLWSVGVILYEMLAGRVPFHSESITEICGMVFEDTPRALRELCPGLPPELERVVARCLEKRPEARFQSARELLEALRPFAAPQRQGSLAELPRAPAPSLSGAALVEAQPSAPPPTPLQAAPPLAAPPRAAPPQAAPAPAPPTPAAQLDAAASAARRDDPEEVTRHFERLPSPPSTVPLHTPSTQSTWQSLATTPPVAATPPSPGGPAPALVGAPPRRSRAPLFAAIGAGALIGVGGLAFLVTRGPEPTPSKSQPAREASQGPSSAPSPSSPPANDPSGPSSSPSSEPPPSASSAPSGSSAPSAPSASPASSPSSTARPKAPPPKKVEGIL